MTITLSKGQYKLNGLTFGSGTNIIVTQFDAQPHDMNVQDYQVTRADSIRFGYDSFKPTTVNIAMEVIYNWKLPPYTNGTFWADKPTVEDLAVAWRADLTRVNWGAMLPLYFCGRDGITKMILGRPGQFTFEKPSHRSTIVKCMGEFRRADTVVYSALEDISDLSSATVWATVD